MNIHLRCTLRERHFAEIRLVRGFWCVKERAYVGEEGLLQHSDTRLHKKVFI